MTKMKVSNRFKPKHFIVMGSYGATLRRVCAMSANLCQEAIKRKNCQKRPTYFKKGTGTSMPWKLVKININSVSRVRLI